MISKAVSSTIFSVFGITQPGTETRFLGSLVNTLLIRPMARSNMLGHILVCVLFILRLLTIYRTSLLKFLNSSQHMSGIVERSLLFLACLSTFYHVLFFLSSLTDHTQPPSLQFFDEIW